MLYIADETGRDHRNACCCHVRGPRHGLGVERDSSQSGRPPGRGERAADIMSGASAKESDRFDRLTVAEVGPAEWVDAASKKPCLVWHKVPWRIGLLAVSGGIVQICC